MTALASGISGTPDPPPLEVIQSNEP
jgi:hypothetical protein